MATVHIVQILTVGGAGGGGRVLHLLNTGLHIGAVLGGQGVAGLLGGGGGGGDKAQGAHGLLLEILVPGLGVLLLGIESLLLLKGEVGIQTHIAQAVAAHLADHVVVEAEVGLVVVKGHVLGLVGDAVNGNRVGFPLDNAAVVDQQGHGDRHKQYADDGVENGALPLRGLPLGFLGGLFVNAAGGEKFLTLFALSGCTHDVFYSFQVNYRRGPLLPLRGGGQAASLQNTTIV